MKVLTRNHFVVSRKLELAKSQDEYAITIHVCSAFLAREQNLANNIGMQNWVSTNDIGNINMWNKK